MDADPHAPADMLETLASSSCFATGNICALVFVAKVLAITHPDPAQLNRVWHAAKDGEIERLLHDGWAKNSTAFRDGYTSVLSGVESIIDSRLRRERADEE